MTGEETKRQYHPAFRVLMWAVPAAALAVIAAILLRGGPDRTHTVISPRFPTDIPMMGFAEIDTIIAGAEEAFEEEDWDESARLLARARFFIESGIREGAFTAVPPRLDLILGIAEFNRGYHGRGIGYAAAAADADPRGDAAVYILGLMYHWTGETGKAKEAFERAAALEGPNAGRAREMLDGH